MQAAIFLDRDGVIIENRPGYVRSWEDVEIFPQAVQAIARFKDSPFKIVIITNQAGIGRGLISAENAEEINRRLVAEIEKAGGRIDGIYVCPHRPEDRCSCRKPQPGLLLRAAEELRIDLSRSVMIGDALSDLQAGQAAGVKHTLLVRTGRGQEQCHSPQAADLDPFLIYDTLSEALDGLAA